MACNALKQMILQVRWGILDFLLIDMPPGTGDIHIPSSAIALNPTMRAAAKEQINFLISNTFKYVCVRNQKRLPVIFTKVAISNENNQQK